MMPGGRSLDSLGSEFVRLMKTSAIVRSDDGRAANVYLARALNNSGPKRIT